MTSELFMVLLLFLTTDQKDRQGTCPRTRPASAVSRQAAQGYGRAARLYAGLCQGATKRTPRAWGRWGKRFTFSPSRASYASRQGADRSSVEKIPQRPLGEITKGSFFLTGPSHLHAVLSCVPWEAGAHRREKPGSLVFYPRPHRLVQEENACDYLE
jgi:hypothetical protein